MAAVDKIYTAPLTFLWTTSESIGCERQRRLVRLN